MYLTDDEVVTLVRSVKCLLHFSTSPYNPYSFKAFSSRDFNDGEARLCGRVGRNPPELIRSRRYISGVVLPTVRICFTWSLVFLYYGKGWLFRFLLTDWSTVILLLFILKTNFFKNMRKLFIKFKGHDKWQIIIKYYIALKEDTKPYHGRSYPVPQINK